MKGKNRKEKRKIRNHIIAYLLGSLVASQLLVGNGFVLAESGNANANKYGNITLRSQDVSEGSKTELKETTQNTINLFDKTDEAWEQNGLGKNTAIEEKQNVVIGDNNAIGTFSHDAAEKNPMEGNKEDNRETWFHYQQLKNLFDENGNFDAAKLEAGLAMGDDPLNQGELNTKVFWAQENKTADHYKPSAEPGMRKSYYVGGTTVVGTNNIAEGTDSTVIGNGAKVVAAVKDLYVDAWGNLTDIPNDVKDSDVPSGRTKGAFYADIDGKFTRIPQYRSIDGGITTDLSKAMRNPDGSYVYNFARVRAFVDPKSSVAIGNNVLAQGEDTIAIGHDTNAQVNSVAIGSYSNTDTSAVALGRNNNARYQSVAIGVSNDTKGYYSIALGSHNKSDYSGIALGFQNEVTGNNSQAIGQNNKIVGNSTIALGDQNEVRGNQWLGNGYSKSDGSVAIGSKIKAYGNNATVVGSNSKTEVGGTIIGSYASVTNTPNNNASTAVALGDYSVANRNKGSEGYLKSAESSTWVATGDAVSVGGNTQVIEYYEEDGKHWNGVSYVNHKKGEIKRNQNGEVIKKQINLTRQITNVAAGSEDTDAVNIAQLKAVEGKIANKANVDASNVSGTNKTAWITKLNEGVNLENPTGALVKDSDVKTYVEGKNYITINDVTEDLVNSKIKKGDLTGEGIEVSAGNGKLLGDVKISIKDGAITKAKLEDELKTKIESIDSKANQSDLEVTNKTIANNKAVQDKVNEKQAEINEELGEGVLSNAKVIDANKVAQDQWNKGQEETNKSLASDIANNAKTIKDNKDLQEIRDNVQDSRTDALDNKVDTNKANQDIWNKNQEITNAELGKKIVNNTELINNNKAAQDQINEDLGGAILDNAKVIDKNTTDITNNKATQDTWNKGQELTNKTFGEDIANNAKTIKDNKDLQEITNAELGKQISSNANLIINNKVIQDKINEDLGEAILDNAKVIDKNTTDITNNKAIQDTWNKGQELTNKTFGEDIANNAKTIKDNKDLQEIRDNVQDSRTDALDNKVDSNKANQDIWNKNQEITNVELGKDIAENKTAIENKEIVYMANGKNEQSVKLSKGLNFLDGKNITAEVAADGVVKYNLKAELEDITAISNGKDGAKITFNKDDKNINVNSGKLTGLADGEISETSTDAVTGKQLKKIEDAIKDGIGADVSNKLNISGDNIQGNLATMELGQAMFGKNVGTAVIDDSTRLVQAKAVKAAIDAQDQWNKGQKETNKSLAGDIANNAKTIKDNKDLQEIRDNAQDSRTDTLDNKVDSNKANQDIWNKNQEITNAELGKDIAENKTAIENKEIVYMANGKNEQSVKLSKGLNFLDGKNITAEVAVDGVVKYNLKAELEDITAISNGKDGAKITFNKDDKNINVNSGKLTGLADGEISETSTDAVTGKQLKKIEDAIKDGITTDVSNKLNITGDNIQGNLATIELGQAMFGKNVGTAVIDDSTRLVQAKAVKAAIDAQDQWNKGQELTNKSLVDDIANNAKTIKDNKDLQEIRDNAQDSRTDTLDNKVDSNKANQDIWNKNQETTNAELGKQISSNANLINNNKVIQDKINEDLGGAILDNAKVIDANKVAQDQWNKGQELTNKTFGEDIANNAKTIKDNKDLQEIRDNAQDSRTDTLDNKVDSNKAKQDTWNKNQETTNAELGKDIAENKIAIENKEIVYMANGKNERSVKLSKGLNFLDGKNITAEVAADGVVKYNLKAELEDITAISNGKDGAKITFNKDDKNINVNSGKLTGLADGEISETSTDAVTGKQLKKIEDAIKDGITTDVSNKLNITGDNIQGNLATIELGQAMFGKNVGTAVIDDSTRLVQAKAVKAAIDAQDQWNKGQEETNKSLADDIANNAKIIKDNKDLQEIRDNAQDSRTNVLDNKVDTNKANQDIWNKNQETTNAELGKQISSNVNLINNNKVIQDKINEDLGGAILDNAKVIDANKVAQDQWNKGQEETNKNLADSIAKNEQAIQDNKVIQGIIDNAQDKRIDALDNKVDANKKAQDAWNKAQEATNKNFGDDIAANKMAIEDNQNAIAENKDAIDKNAVNIDINKKAIDKNSADIADNTANITNNTNAIEANKKAQDDWNKAQEATNTALGNDIAKNEQAIKDNKAMQDIRDAAQDKRVDNIEADLSNKANKSLDNIDNEGKTVIKELAKEAVKVVDGKNTTVTKEEKDGNVEYKVNVDENLQDIKTISNGEDGAKITLDDKDKNIDVNGGKITNVADGTAATDAVNKGQLDKAIANVAEQSISYRVVDNEKRVFSENQVKLSEGLTFKGSENITGYMDKDGGVTYALKDNIAVDSITANKSINVGEGDKAISLDGEKGIITAGKGDNSVIIDGANGSISTGATTISKDGVIVGGKDGVTIKDNTISGIKTEKIEDATDAVNKEYVDNSIGAVGNAISGAIGEVRDEMSSMGAHNAALSALKVLQYRPEEKTQIMAGVGRYKNKNAYALGLAVHSNEDLLWNGGISFGSGNTTMVNAGVTWRVGTKGAQDAPEILKNGPITAIKQMNKDLTHLKNENILIKNQNTKLQQDNDELRKQNEIIIKENKEMKEQMQKLMDFVGMTK